MGVHRNSSQIRNCYGLPKQLLMSVMIQKNVNTQLCILSAEGLFFVIQSVSVRTEMQVL